MPFVTVEKNSRGLAYSAEPEIRMGSHLQSTKGTSRGVYFAMTRAVVEQAGWKSSSGIISKDREVYPVAVKEGVGEDAGFWLLTQSDEGHSYTLGLSAKSSRSFSMSVSITNIRHYAMSEVPTTPNPVEFTIDEKDHSVLIQVPDWLRYNSLSYQAPPPQPVKETPPTRPTQAVRKGGKSTSVVSEIARDIAAEGYPDNRRDRRLMANTIAKSLR